MTMVKGMLKYVLGAVGVQEVRWDMHGTGLVGQFTFFYGK
jgi:hypothetical protein